jgi:hypothetical protein
LGNHRFDGLSIVATTLPSVVYAVYRVEQACPAPPTV